MYTREALPHRAAIITDVMREDLHGPEAVFADGELVAQALVQLQVHVEVGLYDQEASRLIPRLRAGIVARPGLETNDASFACKISGLVEEVGGNALPLMIRMHREMPDHPAQTWSILSDGPRHLFALDIDDAHDLAAALGDELDRGMPVVLFGLTDVIEERGVEERQDAAYHPTSLVALAVLTDCEPIGHVPIVRTGSGVVTMVTLVVRSGSLPFGAITG